MYSKQFIIRNYNHFQHLLKIVLEEESNTNFNFKNSNKKNTTQVIPFKSFSAISGSNTGLRTRVYTQGLDNDKLKVDFDSIDFSSTSSNEGVILCNIKYDGLSLIEVLNSYVINKDRQNIQNKMRNKKLYSRNTIFTGKLQFTDFYTNTQSTDIFKNINVISGINKSNEISSSKSAGISVKFNNFKNKKTNSIITSNLGTNQRLAQNIQTNLEKTSSLSNNNEEEYYSINSNSPRTSNYNNSRNNLI